MVRKLLRLMTQTWFRSGVVAAGTGGVVGLVDGIRSYYLERSVLVPEAWLEVVLTYILAWLIIGTGLSVVSGVGITSSCSASQLEQ